MKLTNPTDAELNAAFAEEVCGWRNQGKTKGVPALNNRWVLQNRSLIEGPLQFCRSFDAVLPFLKGAMWSAQEHIPGFGYTIEIRHESIVEVSGRSSGEGLSLPRAAVIALLRAHGVEVDFR